MGRNRKARGRKSDRNEKKRKGRWKAGDTTYKAGGRRNCVM